MHRQHPAVECTTCLLELGRQDEVKSDGQGAAAHVSPAMNKETEASAQRCGKRYGGLFTAGAACTIRWQCTQQRCPPNRPATGQQAGRLVKLVWGGAVE